MRKINRTINNTINKSVKLFFQEVFQEQRHILLCIVFQRVVPVADAPVVHHSPFAHGVNFGQFVDRTVRTEFAGFLPLVDDLPQQFVVQPAVVQQMPFTPGDQLRGE